MEVGAVESRHRRGGGHQILLTVKQPHWAQWDLLVFKSGAQFATLFALFSPAQIRARPRQNNFSLITSSSVHFCPCQILSGSFICFAVWSKNIRCCRLILSRESKGFSILTSHFFFRGLLEHRPELLEAETALFLAFLSSLSALTSLEVWEEFNSFSHHTLNHSIQFRVDTELFKIAPD